MPKCSCVFKPGLYGMTQILLCLHRLCSSNQLKMRRNFDYVTDKGHQNLAAPLNCLIKP